MPGKSAALGSIRAVVDYHRVFETGKGFRLCCLELFSSRCSPRVCWLSRISSSLYQSLSAPYPRRPTTAPRSSRRRIRTTTNTPCVDRLSIRSPVNPSAVCSCRFISMDRVLCSPDRMEDFSSTTFPLDRARLRCENRASSPKTIFNQVSAARVWLLPDPTVRRWFSS